MANCFTKYSLVLLFLLTATALLPALEQVGDVTSDYKAMIAEIEVIRGEQNSLYVRAGKREGVKLDGFAFIYTPSGDKIGQAKVIEVYSKLCKLKVLNKSTVIPRDGYVVLEVVQGAEYEAYREEERLRQTTFSVLKYNGKEGLLLKPNSSVKVRTGQRGMINENKGSIGGSGQVEVVKIFKNAILVRLLGDAYVNATDTRVHFAEDSDGEPVEAVGDESVVSFISTFDKIYEKAGKLYLRLGSRPSGYIPQRNSPAYIYNDNMLFEKAAVVKFNLWDGEIININAPIDPNGVVVWTGERGSYTGDEELADVDPKVPPLSGLVKEVERVEGRTYLYVALGKESRGYKVGLYGYVYADPEMTTRLGKIKVLEIHSKLSKVELILEEGLVFNNAVVNIEVDPRYLIKKSD